MIASLLIDLDQDPSVLIGAELPALGGNMRYGAGDMVVAEVDESDPGFSRITSHLALVTNLGDDHIAEGFSERRNYHASKGRSRPPSRHLQGTPEPSSTAPIGPI